MISLLNLRNKYRCPISKNYAYYIISLLFCLYLILKKDNYKSKHEDIKYISIYEILILI